MNKEKLRQEHNRELEEKEQEMEDMRASSQKKVRFLTVVGKRYFSLDTDWVLFIKNNLIKFIILPFVVEIFRITAWRRIFRETVCAKRKEGIR